MQGYPVVGQEYDAKEYWHIKVRGMEWAFLMNSVLKEPKLERDEVLRSFATQQEENGATLFMLKKDVFTEAMLLKYLGVTEEQLATGKPINLQPPEYNGKQPTVRYYGTA
jgi:hypothetical protein